MKEHHGHKILLRSKSTEFLPTQGNYQSNHFWLAIILCLFSLGGRRLGGGVSLALVGSLLPLELPHPLIPVVSPLQHDAAAVCVDAVMVLVVATQDQVLLAQPQLGTLAGEILPGHVQELVAPPDAPGTALEHREDVDGELDVLFAHLPRQDMGLDNWRERNKRRKWIRQIIFVSLHVLYVQVGTLCYI